MSDRKEDGQPPVFRLYIISYDIALHCRS